MVPDPHLRQLLDDLGTEVYQDAVSHGWIEGDDPAYADGSERGHARDVLVELGLLRFEEDGDRYLPLDPTPAADNLVVPLAQQGSDLLRESTLWNATLRKLTQQYRTSGAGGGQGVTEIHSLDAINSFIDTQLISCAEELLTAQPYGRRRATTLAAVEERDRRALERGVHMRTLYQHSARQSIPTREYVAEVAKYGAEVRTLDEFFARTLIFDRHTALIPASENHVVAVAISDPSVVAYLVDIFDRAWERALPFTTSPEAARTVADDVRSMTLRMLVEGHSDAASAKRMGVSPRTYASYIAALKEEYGVQTRFQLAWAMSRGTLAPD